MQAYQLTYGSASVTGTNRKVNCDVVFARTWSDIPRFNGQTVGLFIVAYGLSVQESGAKAAQLAVQIVGEEISADIFHQSDVSIHLIMTAAVHKANRQIMTEVLGFGVSLTVALFVDNQVHIAHVGDSRAYLISSNDTKLLTQDHTWSYELVRRGHLTQNQLSNLVIDDVLYRALGLATPVEIDIIEAKPKSSDWILLCTKGLLSWCWKAVNEENVKTILAQNEPQTAADQLVALAQSPNSIFDTSVIVVRLVSDYRIPTASPTSAF